MMDKILKLVGKSIVSVADIKTSALYDFDSEDQGMPGFWIGRATLEAGGSTLYASRRGRGPVRAQLMAAQALAEIGLQHFEPQFPAD